ncbi:MAG TPA: hypothetical protein VMI33_27375 [Streptosporangiaceae bacterium]|nr:hypothetical protein [Streptosporangiaceae bacterium]
MQGVGHIALIYFALEPEANVIEFGLKFRAPVSQVGDAVTVVLDRVFGMCSHVLTF